MWSVQRSETEMRSDGTVMPTLPEERGRMCVSTPETVALCAYGNGKDDG